MGLLDGLRSFNEDWQRGAKTVLDNDAFSVQDTVRGGAEQATGSDSPEEFAEDISKVAKGANNVIATPGREFGKATKGTALDRGWVGTTLKGVGGAGEEGYELFIEYPAAVGTGTLTGAKPTENPEHAEAGYAPDALDTAELALRQEAR
jgi:hypothetical protein